MIIAKFFSRYRRAYGIPGAALQSQFGFMLAGAIMMFLVIVVPFLVSAPNHHLRTHWAGYPMTGNPEIIARYYRQAFEGGIYLGGTGHAIAVAVILSILAFACALSSARHMHSMKMTDLYHSLPVRREKLMLTNLGASMVAALGPLLVITVLTTLGILIAYGGHGWVGGWFFAVIALDFLTIAAAVFVMYAFTTFIAVQVGTTFDAFALTGLLCFSLTVVYLVGGLIWQETVYGVMFNADWALRLSPFLFFFERLDPRSGATLIGVLLAWILVGAALFAAAIVLYKKRKSEVAGTTQPNGIVQMIAKLFTVFCAGALFLLIFFQSPLPGQIIAIIVAGVVIGLLAELILSRGVKFIPRNIKWLALAGVVYSMLYVGMYYDVLGHSTRVPSANSIVSISINYRGRFENETNPDRFFPAARTGSRRSVPTTLTQPESIAIVRDVHQRTVDDFVARGGRRGNQNQSRSWTGNSLVVQYNLRGGGTFERIYSNLSDENFLLLTGLEDRADFIASSSPLFFMEEYMRVSRRQVRITAEHRNAFGSWQSMGLRDEQITALIAALQEDMLRESLDEILSPVLPVVGYIQLTYQFEDARQTWGRNSTEVAVPLTQSYTSTLRLLNDFGMADLVAPDYSRVYEIVLIDLVDTRWHGTHNRAVSMTMGGDSDNFRHLIRNIQRDIEWYREHGRESADVLDQRIFILDDPKDIEHILGRGHATMVLSRQTSRYVMLMQLQDSTGTVLFTQYIMLWDLPESIRTEATQAVERQYEFRHAPPVRPQGLEASVVERIVLG